jgi:hypothetical protein
MHVSSHYMQRSVRSASFILAFALAGCAEAPTDNKSDSGPDTIASIDTLHLQTDTLSKDSLETLRDVSNWKSQDFIVDAGIYSTSEVWSSIDWQLEQVKNLKSPFLAKFTTVEIHDYFHLNFETENGQTLDCGDGENNLGEYVLYSAPDYIENPKYAGKTFLVYWNWEIATFQCCSGSYNTVKAYVPTITKLELQN